MAKTGAQHLKSLQDGRCVYLNGKLVDDVTTHPAYRNAVGAAASLYDFQAHPRQYRMDDVRFPDLGRARQSMLAAD